MKKIGILKEFDKFGRLVIPKELRDRYAFDGKIELVATDEGLLLKSQEYFLTKRGEDQSAFSSVENRS